MKPLSLIIDARKLRDGGIGVYLENLILGLSRRKLVALSLIVRSADESYASSLAPDSRLIEDNSPLYSLEEMFSLPRRLKKTIAEHEVYHAPHYTLPYNLPIPSVVTIHDTIHLCAPEKLSQRIVGGYLIKSAIKRASRVVTVSGVSLARLGKIVPGVPITVIHNALAPGFNPVSYSEVQRVVAKLKLRQPFVLFVGSDRPHKGFADLVDAVSLLKDFRPLVVAVGDRFSEKTRKAAKTKLGPNGVCFVGCVSRDDLVALYNGTRAAIVPSRIEGFGLVALEAIACGAPLICSPEPSLKEVAGNCAWYTSTFEPQELAELLASCLENREIADEKAAAGLVRAQEFSNARSTEAYIQIYMGLLSQERESELLSSMLDLEGDLSEMCAQPIELIRESTNRPPVPNISIGTLGGISY
jgi:alpha-1,3-rhamnosyl/mannosyltransferase